MNCAGCERPMRPSRSKPDGVRVRKITSTPCQACYEHTRVRPFVPPVDETKQLEAWRSHLNAYLRWRAPYRAQTHAQELASH